MVESDDKNSQTLFPHALKLYCFRDRGMVTLSLRSSPYQVVTFYFPVSNFEEMLTKHNIPGGYDTEDYFIFQKKDFLRFTQKCNGYANEFRVPTEKWKAMVSEYRQKLAVPNEDIINCTIT